MSNLKVRFLQDYTQHDSDFKDGVKHFVAGKVVSFSPESAMHYVNRNVAELVGSRTQVSKPEASKQVELTAEDLQSKDVPELVAIAKKKWPDVELPDLFEQDQLIAFIGSGDVSEFVTANAVGAVAGDEDTRTIGEKITGMFKGLTGKDDVDLASLEVSELLAIAKEAYPDASIPDEPTKDQLIAFINSGDPVSFAAKAAD